MSHADRRIRFLVRLVHAGCAALLALAATAVCAFVVLPGYQKAKQADKSAADYQHELNLITEVRTSRSEISREMQYYRDLLKQFEAQLPSSAKIDRFLRGFSALAAACQVQIDDIRPRALSAGTIYWQLPILVRARARFLDYFQFLAKLQQYARITRIEQLQVTATPQQKVCDFEMTVLIYASGPGRRVT